MYLLRNKQKAFMLLLCFIFLTYLCPFVNPPQKSLDIKNNRMQSKTSHIPMRMKDELSILDLIYNENELLTSVSASHVILTNMSDEKRIFFKGIFIAALLLIGGIVLLRYRNNFMKPVVEHLPLLSIYRGGHAPPQPI